VFGHANIMGSPGYLTRSGAIGNAAPAAGGVAGFDQRAGNSVAYWSPKWSGLSFKLQGSLDEFSASNGSTRPYLVAGALNYDNGGLSLVAQFDYRADYFGIRVINTANTGAQASADAGFRLAAGYNFQLGEGSSLRVIAWAEGLAYTQENATAGYKSYARGAYLVGATYKMGDHEFRARYSLAAKPTIKAFDGGTLAAGAEDNLGAQNIVVGYGYNLAKSTQLYAYYSQIMNEDAARYTFGVGGVGSVTANVAPGADPMAIGLGIRHSF
jgi:predicted porin